MRPGGRPEEQSNPESRRFSTEQIKLREILEKKKDSLLLQIPSRSRGAWSGRAKSETDLPPPPDTATRRGEFSFSRPSVRRDKAQIYQSAADAVLSTLQGRQNSISRPAEEELSWQSGEGTVGGGCGGGV